MLFALACAGSLVAQNASQQISGFVRDSTGAVIPAVRVTAIQPDTGLTRAVASNESGYYVISNIPIGIYDITAEVTGFKRFSQQGIKVDVNSKPTVDIGLELGSATESISVTADRVGVESNTGDVGRLVTGEQATKLQLNGRNFAQLLALLPGVSTINRSSFDLFGGYGSNMSSQSINGSRTYTFSWNIDGADNKDNGGGGNNFVNVNPDAIAEFKVLTSNYGAEYGQNSGAVVNVALKSGTKDFHGALYEFIRNDAFDARAFNAQSKQKLRFNNFGGNLGGPIFIPGKFNSSRDKLFFFVGLEFKRLRQGNVNTWNVPSLAQRSGDFSALNPAQWPKDPVNGFQPFPGGVIPSNLFSPNSSRLIGNYPAPNFSGPGGNYVFFTPNPLDTNQYIYKVDYNLNEKHQISVHYLRDYYTSLQNTTNLVLYERDIPGTNASAKWTFVPTPTSVNTLQFTFTGNVILQGKFQPNSLFVNDYSRAAQGVNYPMIYGNETSIPSLNIAGFNGLGVAPRNWNNFNRIFQFKDDFSKIVANHNLKFGALIMRSRKNQDNQPDINGTVNFSTGHALSSGNALADALLGNFNSYSESSSGREGWFRFSQFELYAADNWKVSQRLSLDLGVRYMIMQPQYAALQNAVVFSPAYFDYAKIPVISPANGLITPGTGDPVNGLVAGGDGLPDFAASRIPNADDPNVQRIYRGLPKEISPWANKFGPRLGFAFDLTGRQQTVIRGGYGLFYERIQGNFLFSRVNNPPFVQQATVFTANLEAPSSGTTRISPSNVSSYDTNVKIPSVQNYSLGIQHKLASDTVLDIAFIGSSGWDQYRQVNLNQLPSGTIQRNAGVNPNALRPYPGYADITQFITGSNFNYNSLQAQVRKEFKGSGIITGSYTWAKAITDASDYNELPQDSYNFKADRGLASYDRRHIFVFSYVYPIPFWSSGNTWYKKAFGGWQISGVTTLQSGRPVNITLPGDTAGTAVTGQQRPNVVGDPYADAHTATRWFNPAAFAVPSAGTFGNLGRNAIIGPGTNNWDVSLQKIFAITERVRTEFRAEVYNAPHHFSYFGVASQVGAANFGQVTSATDPRTFQFGLRLTF
jgi:hypothetical protein